jgi:hypothetical protein
MKPKLNIALSTIYKRAALFLSFGMLSSLAFSQVLPVSSPSGPAVHKTIKKKKPKLIAQESLIPDTTAVDTADEDYKALNPGIDMKAFGIKAKQKTDQLTDYISILISNKTSRDQAYRTIVQACQLFSSPDDRVEVSSINTKDKQKYRIHEYLSRLQLKFGLYDAIKIDYAVVRYASKFLLGTDGNFHGVVTLEQTFKGYIDGKAVYSDITKKNIEIVVKKYQKETEGKSVTGWDVFLGDVGVVQTMKLKKN